MEAGSPPGARSRQEILENLLRAPVKMASNSLNLLGPLAPAGAGAAWGVVGNCCMASLGSSSPGATVPKNACIFPASSSSHAAAELNAAVTCGAAAADAAAAATAPLALPPALLGAVADGQPRHARAASTCSAPRPV